MASGVLGAVQDPHAATNPLGGLSSGIGIGWRSVYDPIKFPFTLGDLGLLHRIGLPTEQIHSAVPPDGEGVQFVGGTSAAIASLPIPAVVGDIELMVDVMLLAWSPVTFNGFIGRFGGLPGQLGYYFYLNPDRTLALAVSADGNVASFPNSAPVPFGDGVRVRIKTTYAVAATLASFFYSFEGGPWVSLGTSLAPGITSIFDPTSRLMVANDERNNTLPIVGTVYYAEVRNGIGGPVVARFDPSQAAPGATSWVSDTGETWTLANGAVLVAGNDIQFTEALVPTLPDGVLPNGARNRTGQNMQPGQACWALFP